MLAWPRLCRNGQRGIGVQVWDPPVAWDMCWGLHGVWGRDCQDETTKGSGFISSIAVGRRELLSRHCGAAGLDVHFANTPCPRGAVLAPPHVPIPGGFSWAWRARWPSQWPTEPSESPTAEEELVVEPSCF